MRYELCIVFDDELRDLRHRLDLTESAMGRLARDGAVSSVSREIEIVAVRSRNEFFSWLQHGRPAIVICDMHGSGRFSGNIGARLLRAVSESEETREVTKRVLWTRHNHPEVAGAIIQRNTAGAPYAHAVAHYTESEDPNDPDADESAVTTLEAALRYVIEVPDSEIHPSATFPPVRPVEEWSGDLRRRLEKLTGGAVLRGDERIALDVYHGIPDTRINDFLQTGAGGGTGAHRPRVGALLEEIKSTQGARSLQHAREMLTDAMAPVAQEGIDDPLNPELVRTADRALDMLRDLDFQERRRETWLDEPLERVARVFISRAKAYAPTHGGEQAAGAWYEAVTKAELHPDYVAARDAAGLTDDDVTYALWMLADTLTASLREG